MSFFKRVYIYSFTFIVFSISAVIISDYSCGEIKELIPLFFIILLLSIMRIKCQHCGLRLFKSFLELNFSGHIKKCPHCGKDLSISVKKNSD